MADMGAELRELWQRQPVLVAGIGGGLALAVLMILRRGKSGAGSEPLQPVVLYTPGQQGVGIPTVTPRPTQNTGNPPGPAPLFRRSPQPLPQPAPNPGPPLPLPVPGPLRRPGSLTKSSSADEAGILANSYLDMRTYT